MIHLLLNKTTLITTFMLVSMGVTYAQTASVTISGIVRDVKDKAAFPLANIVLKAKNDTAFVAGTLTDDEGRYTLPGIPSGNYYLDISYLGYTTKRIPLFVGTLSEFLEVPAIEMAEDTKALNEVVITGKQDILSSRMDKKTYSVEDNVSQTGGSVLQAMQNLPGVTTQDGKVQLRGNDKIVILIDGKQTALTGMGGQSGLDNMPASSIDKIEIINNPSPRYDANGNAGIINIVMKKNRQQGFNGKAGIAAGLGALWVRKQNLPGIRPQYQFTPKINPSLSLNYRKNKVNLVLQADDLYTQTLNKNEFTTRTYDNGTVIEQQLKRNRNTNFFTSKAGMDWYIDEKNTFTISGLYGSEKITDRGDQPFFDAGLSQRYRLWQFLEDELKTTAMASATYQHKFRQPGHLLNIGFNYTFHREDEKYYYDNYLPSSTGTDAFRLLSDEQVYDLNVDYIKPLKYGRVETGIRLRNRNIPTDMNFIPGTNSVLDAGAGGWAIYKELIPAVYGNYVLESNKWEAELGLRIEYVRIQYDVNPDHSTYKSDGYNYTQPFPNLRLAHKFNDRHKLSIFYTRRVDRPNEVDIRIFPKYDDAEILKVGNPALRPQFTHSLELGDKISWQKGYCYIAGYHRLSQGTITRISTIVPNSDLIYAIFQNAGKSFNTGLEIVLSQEVANWYSLNFNGNLYYNQIDAFAVENLYPIRHIFSAGKQTLVSGNLKLNNNFHLPKQFEIQLTAIYLAPDIIPQGRIDKRFSLNLGVKKITQKGKGELFLNAGDLLNTMVTRKTIQGNGFKYTAADYCETQVVRLGYSYKL